MAEEEASARRQSLGGFMQEASTHDGLRKETYLWAASHFKLTDKLGYTAFKAVAVCYAKAADYRSAVLWQEKAVNEIKSRLYSDEVSLRGSVTETMLKEEEKILNNYKKLQKKAK